MVDNSSLYPRIEKILAQQTRVDDKNQFRLPGVKRSFVISLTPEDCAFWKDALVFDTEGVGTATLHPGSGAAGRVIAHSHRKPAPNAAAVVVAAELLGGGG